MDAGDKVRRRPVEVAWLGADTVALRGGATAGERVVVAGAPFLLDGEAVRIVP